MNQEAGGRPVEYPNGGTVPPQESAAKKKVIDAVKDICSALVRAVSATKIFPPGHDSIAQLRGAVFSKLYKYLDEHGRLDIDIKQGTFLYLDEIVHQEDNPLRGLPYFFHKDGMQKLSFLKGLTHPEFTDFLDVVRSVSFLPIDVGDIVDSLWEKDFEHIRYLSPDEFIEAKLSEDHELPKDFEVRKESLYEGTLEFTAEDAEDIFRRSMELCRKTPEELGGTNGLFAPLTEGDAQALDDRLAAERGESVEKEFPEMMFEVLRLEDRPEPFSEILKSLEHHLHQWTLKLDFTRAVDFLNKLSDVAGLSASEAAWKGVEIDHFYDTVRSRFPLGKILEKALEERIPNARAFFEYLKFVGPGALPLAAPLLKRFKEIGFMTDAQSYLEDMAGRAPQVLVDLASQDKSEFAKAVVAILGRKANPEMIPYLMTFATAARQDVRFEAIRALGKFPGEAAQDGLSALLDDPDDEVRSEVLKVIAVTPGGELTRRLTALATAKDFHKKSAWEKEAVLKALARSRSDAVCGVLLGLVKRSGLFGRARILETRICAVQALAMMATPEAVAALKSQSRRRPNILRMEIQSALKQLPFVSEAELRRPV